MHSLPSYFSRLWSYILCIFLATNMSSCSCTHPKISQGKKPTSSNSNTPGTDSNNNTPGTNNNPPIPPTPPTSIINEAIKQLEEEAQAPNADPINKKIYELIRTLPPHKFST